MMVGGCSSIGSGRWKVLWREKWEGEWRVYLQRGSGKGNTERPSKEGERALSMT